MLNVFAGAQPWHPAMAVPGPVYFEQLEHDERVGTCPCAGFHFFFLGSRVQSFHIVMSRRVMIEHISTTSRVTDLSLWLRDTNPSRSSATFRTSVTPRDSWNDASPEFCDKRESSSSSTWRGGIWITGASERSSATPPNNSGRRLSWWPRTARGEWRYGGTRFVWFNSLLHTDGIQIIQITIWRINLQLWSTKTIGKNSPPDGDSSLSLPYTFIIIIIYCSRRHLRRGVVRGQRVQPLPAPLQEAPHRGASWVRQEEVTKNKKKKKVQGERWGWPGGMRRWMRVLRANRKKNTNVA